MARPQKFTLDFFLHDATARGDRKIKSLRRRHGNDGYAAFFCLLEMLCCEDGLKLDLSKSLNLDTAIEECGLRDEAHFYKIVETCVELELFNKQLWEGERIVFSQGLFDRYQRRLETRLKDAERKRDKRAKAIAQKKLEQADIETDLRYQRSEHQNSDIRDQRSEQSDRSPSPSKIVRPENRIVRMDNSGDLVGENGSNAYRMVDGEITDEPCQANGNSPVKPQSAGGGQDSAPRNSRRENKGRRGQTKYRPRYYPEEFAETYRKYCLLCDEYGADVGCPQAASVAWDSQIELGVEVAEIGLGGFEAFAKACAYKASKGGGRCSGIPHFVRYLRGSREHPTPYWKTSLDWAERMSSSKSQPLSQADRKVQNIYSQIMSAIGSNPDPQDFSEFDSHPVIDVGVLSYGTQEGFS